MPYLVKVGYDRNNISEVTSKGYFIKRIGNKVYAEWGPIDVIGLKKKKFGWHKTTYTKTYSRRSEQRAFEFKSEKISYLIRNGYNKLLPGARIYTSVK